MMKCCCNIKYHSSDVERNMRLPEQVSGKNIVVQITGFKERNELCLLCTDVQRHFQTYKREQVMP